MRTRSLFLLLFWSIILFGGCAPKYRTAYTYIEPRNPQIQSCIEGCEAKRAACRERCEKAFKTCRKNAEAIGRRNYEQKLQDYYRKLEAYTAQLRRYELERDLFYGRGFYYGDGFGYRGPFYGPVWWGPSPALTLPRPVKPNLQNEILQAELKHCRVDCGCTEKFDTCFEGCGGKIIRKKVCIENCPK